MTDRLLLTVAVGLVMAAGIMAAPPNDPRL